MSGTISKFGTLPEALRMAVVALTLAAITLIAAIAPASPASATPFSETSVSPTCLLPGSYRSSTQLRTIETGVATRQCIEAELANGRGDWTLIFEPNTQQGAPTHLALRLGKLDTITLSARDSAGTWHQITHAGERLIPTSEGSVMVATLPKISGGTDLVVASIAGNRHGPTVVQASLHSGSILPGPERVSYLVLLSMLVVALVVPSLVYLGFYRVLNEPFLIWYAALSVAVAAVVLIRSGLINILIEMPVEVWRIINISNVAVVGVTGLMFISRFVQYDNILPKIRNLVPYVAVWTLAISVLHSADLPLLRPYCDILHIIEVLPAVLLACAMLLGAYRSGSRAVKILLISIAPAILVIVMQIGASLMGSAHQTDFLPLLYGTMLWQVVMSSWAVADRFLLTKRQRDEALLEANLLSRRSERDPLTGLFNRGALDTRWHELMSRDYRSLAILDIDHFKTVNDIHGHLAGDQVLKIIGQVLRRDPDNVAIRMGGEEFLLMLRGEDAVRRADDLRQRIPMRVGEEMHELDMKVTASMGVLTIPPTNTEPLAFSDLYSRVDLLLYQAKRSGRDQVVAEEWDVLELDQYIKDDTIAAE